MKKILFVTLCFILLLSGSLVNAQFVQSHYYTGNSTLPSDYIAGGVAVDTNNNIWVGTDMGVSKFNGTTWTTYTTANGLPSNIISCIAVDKNNNIWIGTDGDGVAKYNGSTWTTFTSADGLCDNGIHYIAGDINEDVWFGSWGQGVSKLSGAVWTTDTTGLPKDGVFTSINFITVDAFGNKWFGTNNGIAKFDGSSFTMIDTTTVDSLVDNIIYSIAIDAANNKWIGTPNGMTKLSSTNTWVENYRKIDGLYNNVVKDIDIDALGKIWLGSYINYPYDAGISRFDGTNWFSSQIDYPDTVSADQIFRLAVDKNNDIWVAMDYGVIKIDHTSGISEPLKNETLKVYPNPATDNLTINLNETADTKTQVIEIYSCIQKVKEIALPENNYSLTIPLNDLKNGLYFLKIGNTIQKFIVCR